MSDTQEMTKEDEMSLEIGECKHQMSSEFRRLANLTGLKAALQYLEDIRDAAIGKV